MTRRWILGTAVAAALVGLPPAVHAQTLRAQLAAQGFTNPIAFVRDPSMAHVEYVAQQNGLIWTIANGAVSGVLFMDLSGVVSQAGGEGGLLGLAFDPNAASGRFYVNYTRPGDGHTVIARYKRSAANPLVADPLSRFDLMWPVLPGQPQRQPFIVQPYANHNGGNLVFGPDGYLYIGLGDGGAGNDPDHRAQTPGTLLGKMLRIDVDVLDQDAEGYDIPASNPFLSDPSVLPEIWSFGLRNPWRYSFDDGPGGTGALVLADVGQGSWEEVNYEPAGAGGRNYGWRNREGSHDNPGPFPDPPGNLPPYFTPLRDPIHEYDHSQGTVITGGVVYRGHNLGLAFQGRYFFADFGLSRIWSAGLTIDLNGEATVANITEHTATLGVAAQNISHFGVDSDGEVYLVTYGGAIYRLYLELAANGSFNNDMAGWTTFATPDASYLVGGVVNGVFEFYRQPPPPGTTNQAVIFQRTGVALPPATRFAVEFYLGNSSTVRKRIAVLLSDFDFNDVAVCSFWLLPETPLKVHRMRSHSIQAWANATISFYAATPGSDGGVYQIDNVSWSLDSGVSDERTECFDLAVPLPPGGAPGPDLLANGSFASGLAPWTEFGQIASQIAGGVYEFYRPAGQPAGVLLQATGVSLIANSILTATLELGNSSSVRKRVTVILHSLDFMDLQACTFWLAPGQPLMTYQVRTYATQAWTNATLSVYPSTVGTEQWIRLDNVTFRQTPDVPISGTECIEPVTPSPNPGGGSVLRTWPARTTMPLRRTRWLHP